MTPQLDYMAYLSRFSKFDDIPEARKNATYGAYLRDLYDYLRGYLQRTQPLVDIDDVVGPKVREAWGFRVTAEARG